MKPHMSGPSIVDSGNTAGAAKGRNAVDVIGRNAFDVDALVTRTGGSTTGETNGTGPASDFVVLPLHEAEVAASA
jgi:hypothetical protein